MTFTSDFLAQLRAAREQPGSAAPGPQPQAVPPVTPPAPAPAPKKPQRPSMSERAGMVGHCGTCRHLGPAPDWGEGLGVCALGWAAHTPWAPDGPPNSPPLPVLSVSARCMCHGLEGRWALRPGVSAAPDTDKQTGGKA